MVGGCDLDDGLSESSFAPRSCSKLRCSKCDKKVVRFSDNVRWSAKVDYIFVRNYNTQPQKLREGTEHAVGYTAYAC